MKRKYFCLSFILLHTTIYYAQTKSIDTIIIKDPLLENTNTSQKIINISSTNKKNTTNLSEILHFQSPIFIKENGRGLVSSPTVRGGTAQQTSFLWNGIPINSLFLGQGDINNISALDADNVYIKLGAGSLLLGSGAMTASVHLNNSLSYNKGIQGKIYNEYGSFNTLINTGKIDFSQEKFSIKIYATHSKSDNKYEIPKVKYKHKNADYNLLNYGISAGYKFSPNQEINIHTNTNFSTQHFPIFDKTTNPSKYLTNGFRTQMNYQYQNERIHNKLTLALVEESFEYYNDISNNIPSSGGKGKTWLLRNISQYRIPKYDINISFMGELQYNQGKGINSGILNPERKWSSIFFMISKKINSESTSELSIRKNEIKNVKSPWLVSFANSFKINNLWQFNLNISNNFRLPTFNDLYWSPGGNPNLKPETAIQIENMQTFTFNNIKIDFIPYYSYFKDKIQWVPNKSGIWIPMNFSKTKAYGVEFYIIYKKQFQNSNLQLKGSYSYTKSINTETKLQNMYIPINKAIADISFYTKKWNAYTQSIYNGLTFSTTDEDYEQTLKPYFIVNAGINYHVFKQLTIGGKVNNIFNQIYYTSANFPLPLRNYSFNVSYNF